MLNAYDATPDGETCEIDVTVEATGDEARLVVADHGPGIPEPMLERIFEAFVTTKGEDSLGGTGLGLWLSAKIVSQHGGDIRAENKPDGGAQFIVTFPLEQAPSEQPEPPLKRIESPSN